MEEEACLMSCAEQGLWHLWPTEPVNHHTGLSRTTPDLQIVMDGLGREVQKLQVDP